MLKFQLSNNKYQINYTSKSNFFKTDSQTDCMIFGDLGIKPMRIICYLKFE